MIDVYFLIICILGIIAIGDLVVGVSNDAVNFLNSAVGSKAISFKTILILASLGVAFGALFSSGLMEVARKGIFNPGEFYFDEIILIFTAVMLTDILLLDFFNTIGMPTSTTVSIVFELLGAAVFMSFIKIFSESEDLWSIFNYINTSKAAQIILGIVLSVFVALSIGALVQFITRLFLSFKFNQQSNISKSIFGGISLTSIIYFILIKGIKGTPYANLKFDLIGGSTIKVFLETELFLVVILNIIFWVSISFLLIQFFKLNIFKIIIGVGTFALALAFAGNDLVNFIGVPIAAYQAYEAWSVSNIPPSEFSMISLAAKVSTPTLFLILSGGVMIVTLWFSTKARKVMKTEIDLSSQRNVNERFEPNLFSKLIVKCFSYLSGFLNSLIPKTFQIQIEKQFDGYDDIQNSFSADKPSFDMLRASVNLVVASVLISIATSYKLPLSTTYVTFMVAMGTSLADRAWGGDNAVYRVSGVLNVVGGWFLTAIIAFVISGVIVTIIYIGGVTAISIILFIILLIIGKNYLKHKKNESEVPLDTILRVESNSIKGVINESTSNIIKVFKRIDSVFEALTEGISKNEIKKLKLARKKTKKLSEDIEELKDNIFFFIKKLDESSLSASNFYISLLGLLQDLTDDLSYAVRKSYKHINNGHSKLKYSQINDLLEIHKITKADFTLAMETFSNNSSVEIEKLLNNKDFVLEKLDKKIQLQVQLTRDSEISPKNTTLYFNLLLKNKDIYKHKIEIIRIFFDINNKITE